MFSSPPSLSTPDSFLPLYSSSTASRSRSRSSVKPVYVSFLRLSSLRSIIDPAVPHSTFNNRTFTWPRPPSAKLSSSPPSSVSPGLLPRRRSSPTSTRSSSFSRWRPTRTLSSVRSAWVSTCVHSLSHLPSVDLVANSSSQVEQRKRLTIGVELAAKPALLIFLDEPTSVRPPSLVDLKQRLTLFSFSFPPPLPNLYYSTGSRLAILLVHHDAPPQARRPRPGHSRYQCVFPLLPFPPDC